MGDDRPVVRVAVPVPLADVFDYLAPPGGSPAPGPRVRVPFGPRGERVGIVVEHSGASALAPAKLKPIREVLDASAPLGAELMQSLRWAADYYHHPIGEVLSHALPAVLREGRSLDDAPERAWRVTEKGRAQSPAEIERRAKRQAQALAAIRERDATETELANLGIGRDVLERLTDRGWIEQCEPPLRSNDAGPSAADPAPGEPRGRQPPELTPDQLAAVTAISGERAAGFRAYLLHGVTGSGKTEVYLRLIADELAANRQTLLLVPEIGLTPQLVARLRARFGGELALLHSGQKSAGAKPRRFKNKST